MLRIGLAWDKLVRNQIGKLTLEFVVTLAQSLVLKCRGKIAGVIIALRLDLGRSELLWELRTQIVAQGLLLSLLQFADDQELHASTVFLRS